MANTSKGRQLIGYPNAYYSRMMAGYAKVNDLSKSKAATEAFKKLIDSLSDEERAKINRATKNNSKNSY